MLIFFSLLPIRLPADDLNRARKALEKHDWAKASKFLRKADASQPQNPAVHYKFSFFFSRNLNPSADPDSAWNRILRAEYLMIKGVSEKLKKKLDKEQINLESITRQKMLADSLTWSRALVANTETGFQVFIDKHPGSVYISRAVTLRNGIAFAEAKRINTYESFKAFMEKYPDAVEAGNAHEIAEVLLYENETKSGKLDDLIAFVIKNPKNPYSSRVEQLVWVTMSAAHTAQAYHNYILALPESKFNEQAWKTIFYLDKPGLTDTAFIRKYPAFPYTDMLKMPDAPLFAIPAGQGFAFMSYAATDTLSGLFDSIPSPYLCAGQTTEFLKGWRQKRLFVANRAGTLFSDETWDSVSAFSPGIIKVWIKGKAGLWHIGGFDILAADYENLEPFGNLVMFTVKGKKGLMTYSRRQRAEPVYSEITREGKLVIFERGEKYGFIRAEKLDAPLLPSYATDTIAVPAIWDDINTTNNDNLLIRLGERNGLINADGKTLASAVYSNLSQSPHGWVAQANGTYLLLGQNGKPLSEETYEKVFFNNLFYGVKQNGKWGVLNPAGKRLQPCQYDTLRFYGKDAVMLTMGSNIFLSVKEDEWIDFSGYSRVELLTNMPEPGKRQVSFISVTDAKGMKGLYSMHGAQILMPVYQNISMSAPNLLTLMQKGKTALADSTGKILLPFQYDGAGNFTGSWVNILKNHKFGLFNPATKAILKPDYDASLRQLSAGRSQFTALKKGKYGLVDLAGKALVPFSYDEVKAWNENKVLVRLADLWYLYDITAKKQETLAYKNPRELPAASANAGELLLQFSQEGLEGIISNRHGIIVPFLYEELINIGTADLPFYFCGRKLASGTYELSYLDGTGKQLRTGELSADEFEKVICSGEAEE
ncbi:MAG: WG repeat-containing protein [Bacteroidota bacterium]